MIVEHDLRFEMDQLFVSNYTLRYANLPQPNLHDKLSTPVPFIGYNAVTVVWQSASSDGCKGKIPLTGAGHV